MIDTHCHLTFDHYADRVDDVIADARAAGVHGMITVSTTLSDAQTARDFAHRYDNIWCTAGVHPLHSDKAPEDQRGWHALAELARDDKCVAWGELGLDNHYDNPPKSIQQRVVTEQLAMIERLAAEGFTLPIVVHCREAFDELIDVFRQTGLDPSRFVFHCFTGGPDAARKVLDFGAWISFTGVVTFKNAKEVAEAAKLVPLDRMMVETDSPFLTPEPHRNIRPNEPKYVVDVARFLADLHALDFTEIEKQMDANAERFFGITLHEK